MTNDAPIAVFGGATVDRLATASVDITHGASNPGRLTRRVGGVGLGVATILARVGHRVRLVARLGRDDDGRMILAQADADGIDATGVTLSPARATGSYTAVFNVDCDLYTGIADMSVYDEMVPGAGTGIPGHGVDGEFTVVDANLPEATIAFLCGHAASRASRIAALAVSPTKARRLIPSLGQIDWLFANRAEAATLTDAKSNSVSAGDLAQDLCARGVGAAIVTDGDRPLAIADVDGPTMVTPPPVHVVHVNGAGDSLAAGTIHRLAAGAPLASAISSGLAAAALTLEHGGIREAMFSAERLATMTELVEQER